MPQRPCQNYLDYRAELETIDDILKRSGLDDFMIDEALRKRYAPDYDPDNPPRGEAAFIRHCRSGFRICILRSLKQCASVRGLEITLADSPMEQWFCFVENFDQIKAPSKSSIDRYKKLFGVQAHEQAFAMLLQKAASTPDSYDPQLESAINLLGFEMPADLLEVWYDSTCHSPNIHFPVDWVQLGDCCRSLLKAIRCIRTHGIKKRMPRGGADCLLSTLNKYLIALGNARRRKDSKRKALVRILKKFAKRVEQHARSHRLLLETHREEKTTLSEGQARVIIERIEKVLAQLPQAIKQAHERIIGERRVPNHEKILSIYEPSVKVIKRGKSGAEVEYGNQLLLGENREGLITYYDLFEDVKSDSARLQGAIEKTQESIGGALRLVVGDRGFSDEKLRAVLTENHPELINHCCAKSPIQMQEQQKEAGFGENQKRRAQTEARIAILTNCYQRARSLSKGLESQRRELHWVVLSHNLRVLARKRLAEDRKRQREQERRKDKPRKRVA